MTCAAESFRLHVPMLLTCSKFPLLNLYTVPHMVRAMHTYTGEEMQHAALSPRDGTLGHGAGPCLQLTLRAKEQSTEAAKESLKEREHALDPSGDDAEPS